MWYVPVVPKIRGWCWQPGVWHPRVDVLCADWPEPEAEDEDWRAAAYAQAATRPCTPEDRAQAEALAQQPLDPYGWRWIRCQSTPPVAR